MSYSFHAGDDVQDKTAGQQNRASYSSGEASPAREQVLEEDPQLQPDRQTLYGAQTQAEVEELEKMITEAATTPRKAKRVCNM